ncbi:MAG: Nif3-like dinuclear metal center hexameric protein [Ruminococcaceae bacterium]|nr:Nif3-like dinuclear metal center hexameric protein [Oscillospiraceae bacterium]
MECGRLDSPVEKILVSLDITNEVIEEADKQGCQLIVSHHPLVFSKLSNVTDISYPENAVISLIEKKICAISCHTNLDIAQNGVNDALFEALELEDKSELPIGKIGTSKINDFKEFALFVKKALGCDSVRCVDSNKKVSKVAVIGGAGGSEIENAVINGADTIVTGEIKYNVLIYCQQMGINAIDAGHFHTERVVLPYLTKALKQATGLEIIQSNQQSCYFNI